MVYELISEKLLTLKSGRRKISTDNSHKITLLKNRISEIKIEQEKLVETMLKDGIDPEMLDLLNKKAKRLADERKAVCNLFIEKIFIDYDGVVEVIWNI